MPNNFSLLNNLALDKKLQRFLRKFQGSILNCNQSTSFSGKFRLLTNAKLQVRTLKMWLISNISCRLWRDNMLTFLCNYVIRPLSRLVRFLSYKPFNHQHFPFYLVMTFLLLLGLKFIIAYNIYALMWSACHKKRYLLCVELTNFGIFTKPFPIFFKTSKTETATQGRDSWFQISDF